MRITVVIPRRAGESTGVTLGSLARQTYCDFDIVTVCDEGRGANWARNRGFQLARTELVLFSDSDIRWQPDATETLVSVLDRNPDAAYSYGAYEMAGRIYCDREFDAQELRRRNYISTMSLVRGAAFRNAGGFDPDLKRLQDWSLWLSMLECGYHGVYCGKVLFHTEIRNGISFGGPLSWTEAERIVKRKHGLR